MWLLRPPGVYRAQADTELLVACVRREALRAGTEVLDLGTGTGAVALAAAAHGARVTAVDVSRRALAAAWLNGAVRRRRIRVRHGDLTGPVRHRLFDLVVSNPPYVPATGTAPPARGSARAWDAGPDGRALLDRICRLAPAVLAPGGVLLLVHSAVCGVGATCRALERAGLAVEVAARRAEPFGPVMTGRAAWLEDRGLVAPGERHEELVVVRGVRTG
ncbi:methyltransferase [Streptacidiphilus sp. ASG 303]|uniref:HemK2/MTQ2 family protein methyltransferase n=1 Tax=Streptacidiphilus sp. ASG 303 TaxID=2896847 RepID=UPI001E39AB90|nr:HemK2/MTQ2 family protein methyltransferase [Streptacidiphilus sp. ASG 303]MCD0484146.1 methyltransferase [Streptacidiphilus sp. ASG 303]